MVKKVEKKENWFAKNPIVGSILGVIVFFFIISLFVSNTQDSEINSKTKTNSKSNFETSTSLLESSKSIFSSEDNYLGWTNEELQSFNYCSCSLASIEGQIECVTSRQYCEKGYGDSCLTYRRFAKYKIKGSCENRNLEYQNVSECFVGEWDCISQVAQNTKNLQLCKSLPVKEMDLYHQGHCIYQLAKTLDDLALCSEIEDEFNEKACNGFFELQEKKSQGLDSPLDKGDGSNIPEFIKAHITGVREINFWAKNFEIVDYEYLAKRAEYYDIMTIKTTDGEVKEIILDVPSVQVMFDNKIACQSNPSCGDFTWIVQYTAKVWEEFETVKFYCPSNLIKCEELRKKYGD